MAVIWLLLATNPLKLEAEVITYPQDELQYNLLVVDILKLALSKSSPEAQLRGITSSNKRLAPLIEDGQLSVIWAGTNKEYESRLRAIKIPVLKGLLGYRIFIIRNGDQKRFTEINSLNELKRLSAGQVKTWTDAFVLMENNIPLVTTHKRENLFLMLEGKRFDYFPRAIHEPWVELENHAQLDLVVEEKILMVYPFALYFFVSKDNEKLARAIEKRF